MSVVRWLDEHFEEILLVFLLVLISCVMLLQIIVRSIPFFRSTTWAEEFSRYCYVWSVFLSIGYTVRKGNMLRVGIVMDLLPQTLRKVIAIIVDVVMLVVFAIFFYYSIGYTQSVRAIGQYSPALHVPMWMMYCATIIGFGLATIRTLQELIRKFIHFNEKEETTLEAVLKEAEEEVDVVLSEHHATEMEDGGGA